MSTLRSLIKIANAEELAANEEVQKLIAKEVKKKNAQRIRRNLTIGGATAGGLAGLVGMGIPAIYGLAAGQTGEKMKYITPVVLSSLGLGTVGGLLGYGAGSLIQPKD